MATSRPVATVHTEATTREPRLNGLIGETPRAHTAFTSVESSAGQWFLDALSESIDATASQKAAAIDMGQDRSQLSNQLKGIGNLYAWRVGLLPKDTLLAFADRIRAHFGVAEDPREGAQQDAEAIAKALCRLVARVR